MLMSSAGSQYLYWETLQQIQNIKHSQSWKSGSGQMMCKHHEQG